MTPQLYILSRKIHRLMVIITSVLALVMMVTGLNMKYGWFFLDPSFSAQLHGELGIYFVVALSINMVTGLYMYIYTLPKKTSQ